MYVYTVACNAGPPMSILNTKAPYDKDDVHIG